MSNPGVPQRRKIIELARRDSIIYAVLRSWQHGDVTWAEAMEVCVEALSKERERLQDLELKRSQERAPVPMMAVCPRCGVGHV